MVGILYFVLSAALIALLGVLGSISNQAPFTEPYPYIAVGLAGFCGWVLVREFRRDLYQLCTYWIFFGFIGVIGSLLLFFHHPVIGAVFGASVVVSWIASIAAAFRSVFIKDERPHRLLNRFGKDNLYEHAGVQIAVEIADLAAMSEGIFEVQVLLQNCWDQERSAEVMLRPRQGLIGRPGGAKVASQKEPLVLKGAEIGVLSIPVEVTTAGRVVLQVTLRTSGIGGRRIWRRPAQTIPMRFPPVITVLLGVISLGTFWAWGGGLMVRIPAAERLKKSGALGQRRWRNL